MTVLDVLREAHKLLQKAVPGIRRKAHQAEGRLAAAFLAAMDIVDQRAADGVPAPERYQGLEGVMRDAWPQVREWKYLCDRCDDTGLVMALCREGARCDGISTLTDPKKARLCTKDPTGTYQHTYGTPCWCAKGDRFRNKPRPSAEDFTAAGKSKPTRFGR